MFMHFAFVVIKYANAFLLLLVLLKIMIGFAYSFVVVVYNIFEAIFYVLFMYS
jgi:hypothetical protein